MRICRVALVLIVVSAFTGCGYVHFGRPPAAPAGDAALATAYSDLGTQHKMLKQELALARKEGDTLRIALERAGGTAGSASSDLVARLNETSQELATLRASYAKLQAESARKETAAASAATAGDAALREENTRLRAELAQVRTQNTSLADQLKLATARYERAESEVGQLSTDLLAHKDARTRAEQATIALRAQLDAVIAQGARSNPAPPSPAAPTSVRASLESAKSPPAR